MTRSALVSSCLLAALTTMMVPAVGCATPDVETFDGVNTPADKDTRKNDGKEDPKETPARSTKPKSTPAPATPDPTPATPTTPTTPTTPPTTPVKPPAQTVAQCFTKCVAPNPTAAAVDTCSNGCPDGDDVCLGDCYFDSGCDVDAACDAAIKTCDTQCAAP